MKLRRVLRHSWPALVLIGIGGNLAAQANPESRPQTVTQVPDTPEAQDLEPTPDATPEIKEAGTEESIVLPTNEVQTPERPPSLRVSDDAEDLEPVVLPDVPTEGSDLIVPQQPLQVRLEATQGLSLDDALEIAIGQNPGIEQARLNVLQSEIDIEEIESAFRPTFSSSAAYRYSQAPDNGNPFASDSSTFATSLFRLDYLFLDGGTRGIGLEQAQEALTVAQLLLDQVIQDVKLSAAVAYYALQNSDADVAINQAAVESQLANLRDAEAQERAGLGTRFDVLRAETELANNQQNLITSQNNQQINRRRLAEILNFPQTTDVVATDPIVPAGEWTLSLEDTIIKAFANRPELEASRRQVDIARDQARIAFSDLQPQVSVFATVDWGLNLQVDDSADAGYSAGANVSWNWSDGGLSKAQAKDADVDVLVAVTDFELDRNEIQREAEDAFLTLLSTSEQIESAKTAIESAEESLRLSRLRFQAGVGTQTEVISSETALTTARGNLSSSIIQYNLALVRLRRAVNEL